MSNVNRLERMRSEIKKARADLIRQQERLKVMEQRLTKMKQTEVMKLVDGANLEPEQLKSILADYQSDRLLKENGSGIYDEETEGSEDVETEE